MSKNISKKMFVGVETSIREYPKICLNKKILYGKKSVQNNTFKNMFVGANPLIPEYSKKYLNKQICVWKNKGIQ